MVNLLIISLHASPNMAPGVSEWGGAHTYMRELLQEIDYSRFNVVFVTRKVFKNQLDIEKINENCKIVNLEFGDFKNFNKRSIPFFHNENIASIKYVLNKLSFVPHVIHSVYWNSGYLAYELSKFYNVNYVHSIISNAIGRNTRGAAGTAENRIETEKIVFHNAKYILCVSDSEKEDLISFYKIEKNKILIAGQYVHESFQYPSHDICGNPRLPNIGVNSQTYSSLQNDEFHKEANWWNNYAFTYVGRLHPDKGIAYIVEAWFKNYNVYGKDCPPLWLIGGNTEDIRKIRETISVSPIELNDAENNHKIIWWGYLDEVGISTLYLKSLCLITNSLYEPGGRVAVEALCQGIPVIASDNGFANDIILDWNNGFIVKHGDVDKLSRRMELFIKNPFLTTVMYENTRSSGFKTVKYWNFIETHLSAYLAAIHDTPFIPQSLPVYSKTIQPRKLLSYPFVRTQIDASDIASIAMRFAKKIDTTSICYKSAEIETSSDVWTFIADGIQYLCKIPYTRINYETFYNAYGYTCLVDTATNRYLSEKSAGSFCGTAPIVASYDSDLAIIREYYDNKDVEVEKTLKDINNFYESNIMNARLNFEVINEMIEQSAPIREIIDYYKQENYEWSSVDHDFSLRVEITRWLNIYDNLADKLKFKLKDFIDLSKSIMNTIAESEKNLTPVLNQGGCNLKNIVYNNEHTMFVDNERIHWGWPGIDYADFLITYADKNKISEKNWINIFDSFNYSFVTPNILLGWLLLSGWKTAISNVILSEVEPTEELFQRQRFFSDYATQLQPL